MNGNLKNLYQVLFIAPSIKIATDLFKWGWLYFIYFILPFP